MSGVEIRVRANTQQARSELKKLEGSVGNIEKATSRLATSIKAAIATYSGFVSVKGITAAADQFTQLSNRLKLVTQEGETVAATMAKLNRLAIQSRTSLTTTATNYQRLARALQGTGRSSQEFLLVTEAINKATKLGGQPLATQEAALFQLSQAFSSGVLRGEEFNSVSEGAPEILRALTQSLGVTRAELREMAFDGQITAEVLTDALLTQLPEIRREFDLLAPTVAETAEIMRSEFTRALAAIDEITGISESTANKFRLLTSAFTFVADNAFIEFNRLKAIIFNFAARSVLVFEDLKKAVKELFSVDFNAEDFKARIDAFISGVTNSDTYKKLSSIVPTVSVDSFVVGTAEVLSKLEAWGEQIKTVFDNIYEYIFGSSPWPAIFEDGHGNPEGSISSNKWINILYSTLDKIKAWGRDIKNAFTDIFLGSEVGPGMEQRSGGVVSFFKDSTAAVREFVAGLDIATTSVSLFDGASEFFSTRSAAIKGFTDELAREIDENGGILGYINKIKENAKGLGSEVSQDIRNAILGTEIVNPYQEAGRESQRVGGLFGSGGGIDIAGEFIKNNQGLLIGGAIVTGIMAVLPAELRSNLIQGAFFVLGAALVQGAILAATSPIGLFIGAITLGPSALELLNESGTTKKIGKAIADGIVGFFETDSEGKSTGQRILDAILNTSEQFGEGLFEGFGGKIDLGLFEIESGELSNKIAGAVSLAAITAATVGIFRNGFIATGKKAAGFIANGIFLNKTKIYKSLDNALISLQNNPNSQLKRDAGTLGRVIGRGITGGLQAYMASEGVKAIGEILAGSDGEISKDEQAFIDGAARVTELSVFGGAVGSVIPGVGTVVGAAIGAAVGAAFEIYKNEDLRQAIVNLGEEVKTIFTQKIPEAFNAALESVKAWASDVGDALGEALQKAWDDVKSGITGVFKNLFTSGDGNIEQTGAFAGAGVREEASGGYISGPGGPKDDLIPAMISNGEYVVQASSVSKFGKGFFDKLNAGIMPKFFSGGTGDPAEMIRLRNQESSLLAQIAQADENILIADREGNSTMRRLGVMAKDAAQAGLERVYASMAALDEDALTSSGDLAKLAAGDGDGKKDKTLGEQFALDFKNEFRQGFTQALATGDFKTFFEGLADSFTMKVIDAFSAGVTEALFGEDGLFAPLFDNIFNWAKGLTSGVAEKVQEGAMNNETVSNLFSNVGKFFKDIFSNVFKFIGGFFGFGGMYQGGVVSNKMQHLYSGGLVNPQIGKDSVPVMLAPGEYVLPSKRVAEIMKSGGSQKSQQVFNVNVSGDVTRQTRKEIVKMIPEITAGVNYQNKEQNRR